MVFGLSGDELHERIGSLAQVVRLDSLIEAEGPARGTRRLRMVNGGGLEIELHPDRALDIGRVSIDGIPVSWLSPVGFAAPQFSEPADAGWLRTFGGGLLATCGLDTFGPAGEDDGDLLGLHGRIGTRPATITRAEATATGVVVEAEIRQARLFGENLLLRRRISSAAGSHGFTVDDTVTNEGFADAPHMILYHANLGWPLIDDVAVLDIPSHTVTPRDRAADVALEGSSHLDAPTSGFREQVYRHDFAPDTPVEVRVTNPRIGVEFTLGFSTGTLPFLHQWKMLGQGAYVLGLEPANSGTLLGRAAARAGGDLPVLAPGQSVSYRLDFGLRRV
ncbi:MAG: aldose 1-epimerase family protein [Burkholderiaceae bacterium]|nr:aldose 1-epimerase family protein [Microbacteriaceae bacterium]